MQPSKEQQDINEKIKEGKNVFVDACIGAGKTTLLDYVCSKNTNKKILYLTFNKLLKEDAKKKIRIRNTDVHNYHGFVYRYLMAYRLKYTHQYGIKTFIQNVENGTIHMPQYDLVLVDEYQDINDDAAKLIKCIDEYQKKPTQWVFVGDMKQKIYDTTTIDVLEDCIFSLREDYEKMDLTNCFRLNEEHAKMLGNIWKKKIKGVNKDQYVTTVEFDKEELYELVNEYKNEDILILTPFRNNVLLNQFINYLEERNPEKFNKKNLYITISDTESSNKPVSKSMIVTTFDGSKGLERKIAIVFGFETATLQSRSKRGDKQIIKNLFLVAASRGKDQIIFIKEKDMLTEGNFDLNLMDRIPNEEFNPSTMFDFCYDTHIEELFEQLETKEIVQEDKSEIQTKDTDYNILLSPAIGVFQEAMFFKDWNYEENLESYDANLPIVKYIKKTRPKTLNRKVLCLTAIETNLIRYYNQAVEDFIDFDEELDLYKRLSTYLSPELKSQIRVSKSIDRVTRIVGRIDTIKDKIPYELKFVHELEKRHFLQLASYLYAGYYEKGILWNTRSNQMFEVSIKNKEAFERILRKTIRKEKR